MSSESRHNVPPASCWWKQFISDGARPAKYFSTTDGHGWTRIIFPERGSVSRSNARILCQASNRLGLAPLEEAAAGHRPALRFLSVSIRVYPWLKQFWVDEDFLVKTAGSTLT